MFVSLSLFRRKRNQCIVGLLMFTVLIIVSFSLIVSTNRSLLMHKVSAVQEVEIVASTSSSTSNSTTQATTPTTTKDPPIFLHTDTNDNHSICALPVYNFTHPTIMHYVSSSPTNPIKNCNPISKLFTKLENSTWSIISEGKNCSARCYYEIAFKELKRGEWMAPGHVDCDFLEAVCWEGEVEVYGYLHTQVSRKNLKKQFTEKEKQKKKPNVFVFLIDSVSFGMAKRSLPKTLSFLSNKIGSVEFPFVNKVGENSQPNTFPLWFGKQVEASRTVVGKKIEADLSYQDYCFQYIDNKTHIFKQFEQSGYVTSYVDDWARHVLDSWPFCKGFHQSPVHHSMRPLQLVTEFQGAEATKRYLEGELCRTKDESVLEYFQQFLNAYKDEPKFAWIWLNNPVHSDFNGIGFYDQIFADFLLKNEQVLNDSYVFFMADHGYRFGSSGLFDTEIGKLEMSNPFLAISVPQSLPESSKKITRMRENAKNLQTHYDTRATLLDIIGARPDKGESYFGEQSQPRTCATLPIPIQYCICQVNKFEVTDSETRSLLGNALISNVNNQLSDLLDICGTYELGQITSLKQFGDFKQNATEHTYRIAAKVKPPSTAHLETVVIVKGHQNSTKHFEFGNVIRLDTYGGSADCTRNRRFDKLCYCK